MWNEYNTQFQLLSWFPSDQTYPLICSPRSRAATQCVNVPRGERNNVRPRDSFAKQLPAHFIRLFRARLSSQFYVVLNWINIILYYSQNMSTWREATVCILLPTNQPASQPPTHPRTPVYSVNAPPVSLGSHCLESDYSHTESLRVSCFKGER